MKFHTFIISLSDFLKKSLNDIKNMYNFIFGTKFSSIFLLHGKHSFGKVINKVSYKACDLMRFIQQTHIYICIKHKSNIFRTLQVNKW